MASSGQKKNQVTLSALIALLFLLFIGLCIVSKHEVNPNPLIDKELWLGIPLFSSIFENPEMKTSGLNSSLLLPLDSINDASTITNVVDEYTVVKDERMEKSRLSESPSGTPVSETRVIRAENDEKKDHVDAEENTLLSNISSVIFSKDEGSPTIAEKSRLSESPSATPVSETRVIRAENDDKKDHVDAEENTLLSNISSVVFSKDEGSPTIAEKSRLSESPSATPVSETRVIRAENDDKKDHVDAEENTVLSNISSVVFSKDEGSLTIAEKPGEIPQLKGPEKEEEESLKPRNAVGTQISKLAEKEKTMCNIYSGRWVKDISYPLYKASSCPYVDEAFNCQDNGRTDVDYQKWRWQANDCELPRFNATDFLERLRGKRLMLVGDSMNRNQFESMLCLLREGLSNKSRMFETHGYRITKGRGYYIFKFMDYNCTVEFCRSHFLVREGRTVRPNGKTRPTLMIDRIDKTAPRWKRTHILVFNTGHWWTHGKTAKGKDYYQEGDEVYGHLDVLTAFRRALTTWGEWIDENLNPAKTHVFYRGYSPAHYRGGQWNSGGRCTGETEPIFSEKFLDSYPVKMQIVEDVIHQMHTPVTILNITRLSEFRKDGHPSAYGKHFTELDGKRPRYQDCSHWCLPGVPDAWNELIYSSLVIERRGDHK